ncbi:bifunctional DNA primase/polymerase [Streptomyces spiramenti]|uniref:DNA primase n=1 Tax=Streptomyces spiramenti TaxID=2720606 RepID=A0ABX1ARP3_9ACTN|nr:bifunctional DNA primase/polymerase [Streptomyces spiramenti]NJP68995.1 DNA primase [Streptomyces spiramenti]
MGFTIGGMRDIREIRRAPRHIRLGALPPEVTAVAEYTGLWGWDVLMGTRAVHAADGRVRCSCGGPCDTPGAHPARRGPVLSAGTTLAEVAERWSPVGKGASVLLATGTRFDAVEAPSAAAEYTVLRLERLGLRLGPVALRPDGSAWFVTAPGTADLLAATRPVGSLRGVGRGGHVLAPPSDLVGPGPMRWLRAPDPENVAAFPDARLLLGTLAAAAARGDRPVEPAGSRPGA